MLHCTGDGDVQQTPFFLYLMRVDGELRGEQVFLHSDDKNNWELQTLGSMYGHQRHAFGGVLQVLVLVRLQTHFAQEISDGGIVDAFILPLCHELTDGVQQLLHVLRAVNTFLCQVQRQGGRHTRNAEHGLGELVCVHCVALLMKSIDETGESLHFLLRSGIDLQTCLFGSAHHVQITPVMLCCVHCDLLHRRLSDASSGETDDAQQCFVVTPVHRQAEIAECIFYLLALVERCAAVDAVGDVEFAQLAFYDAALGIGAVEHGKRIVPLVPHFLNVRGNTQRLRSVVHVRLQRQRLSLLFFRIDGFLDLVEVLVNERISSIDDVLRGAVVLLQFE